MGPTARWHSGELRHFLWHWKHCSLRHLLCTCLLMFYHVYYFSLNFSLVSTTSLDFFLLFVLSFIFFFLCRWHSPPNQSRVCQYMVQPFYLGPWWGHAQEQHTHKKSATRKSKMTASPQKNVVWSKGHANPNEEVNMPNFPRSANGTTTT